MNEHAYEFLRTGSMMGLRVGATLEDVRRLFGTPLQRYRSELTGEEVLKYGALQITVMEGCVEAVTVSYSGEPLPPPLSIVSIPDAHVDLYTLLEELDAHAIGWAIASTETFDRQLTLVTAGGVRIYFDLDQRELQRFEHR